MAHALTLNNTNLTTSIARC